MENPNRTTRGDEGNTGGVVIEAGVVRGRRGGADQEQPKRRQRSVHQNMKKGDGWWWQLTRNNDYYGMRMGRDRAWDRRVTARRRWCWGSNGGMTPLKKASDMMIV